jgi:SAM-dependent methyltransferase
VVSSLGEGAFDAVIFCLLLSYMPSPQLRYECCRRARTLLKPGGLLLIVTPDSNHVAKGAARMKRWRGAVEALGFRRWRYEKLKHAHAMAFRVVEHPPQELATVATAAVNEEEAARNGAALRIPQDR